MLTKRRSLSVTAVTVFTGKQKSRFLNLLILRQRPSRLQLPPNQHGQLNGIVDRGFQLGAGLDRLTSEPNCGNQASCDEKGTTLLFVVGHVSIVGEQKANIKGDGHLTGTNATETKKRRCTASASSPVGFSILNFALRLH